MSLSIETSSRPELSELQRKRKQQAGELAGLMRRVSDMSTAIPAPTYDSVDPYSLVATTLYQRFIDQPGAAPFSNTSTQQGFSVLTRLARWGQRTYEPYCKQQGIRSSVLVLGASLIASYDPLVTTFGNAADKDNQTLETAFGLLTSQRPAYGTVPFGIEAVPGSALVAFAPDIETMGYAQQEIRGHHVAGERRKCPAYGQVMQWAWSKTVQACVENPQLFAASLGAEPVEPAIWQNYLAEKL